MGFLFICIFVLSMAIGIAIFLAFASAKKDIQKNRERARIKDGERNNDRERIAELVSIHHGALFQNWQRTIYVDEYDRVQLDDWEYEVERFFESMQFIPKALTMEASKRRVTKAMETTAAQSGLEDFTTLNKSSFD